MMLLGVAKGLLSFPRAFHKGQQTDPALAVFDGGYLGYCDGGRDDVLCVELLYEQRPRGIIKEFVPRACIEDVPFRDVAHHNRSFGGA